MIGKKIAKINNNSNIHIYYTKGEKIEKINKKKYNVAILISMNNMKCAKLY